ncbi:MAG: NIPSNAP family protein [Gemmatimonadota bacterium]
MDRNRAVATGVALLFVGFAVGRATAPEPADAALPPVVAEVIESLPDADDRVFELRTYTAAEGKHEALLTRFRDHTLDLFEKHGMTNIGYWTPQDAPESGTTLVYVLAHASREAATASWRAFGADPEWQTVYAASREDGPLISGLERVYLDPADFSPMR